MNQMSNPKIKQRMHNLEILWDALDAFFAPFSAHDWARQHGKLWTYADMPYHLAAFNHMVADNFGRGAGQQAMTTFSQLDAWNDEQIDQRRKNQGGPAGMAAFRASQTALRQAVANHSPDASVFIPIIMVGGQRTVVFALQYLSYHTWLHFAETTLRHHNRLPDLPADLIKDILDFQMVLTAGVLKPEDLVGLSLVVVFELTGRGGGTWTFRIEDGQINVTPGADPKPNAYIVSDIATHQKTSYYRMQSPLLALLLRRTRVKGLRAAQQFQNLFKITPDRVWNFVGHGTAPSE